MAKHRFVSLAVTGGSSLILYRCELDGSLSATPDARHDTVLQLPIRHDAHGPYVEPPASDLQLSNLDMFLPLEPEITEVLVKTLGDPVMVPMVREVIKKHAAMKKAAAKAKPTPPPKKAKKRRKP